MLTVSDFYKNIFSCKVYKISIDAGCTCPNRDGTKGLGGCIFCSERGSGEYAINPDYSVEQQILKAKQLVQKKLKGRGGTRQGKYIAYFQNFTSTYGDCKTLLTKYKTALSCENIAGLAIATRPDCLSDELLREIAVLSKQFFVQIELGLQTSNEKIGNIINRCFTNTDYIDAAARIKNIAPEVHLVTHLIFGLPEETTEDMMNSVRFVVEQNNKHQTDACSFFGIKFTVLYILENTKLAELYACGKVNYLSKENYYSLLKAALKQLPDNCVIHRLTGDPPKKLLIEPKWTQDKKRVMNEVNAILFYADASDGEVTTKK